MLKHLYSIMAALLLAVVAFFFFFPDDIEGNVLQQPDTMQGLANGQEGLAYREATGETTRWTNSLFSGMPNFQISPSYPANKVLEGFQKVYSLWMPAPANLLFIMMLGFFIMCLCFKMRWYIALYASIAWGFSTYFIIIIGAGHIWKFLALAYVPPTIGGIVLCYRGRYLAGTAIASLFGAMQLQSNHPQMSYYFGFVIIALIIAWLYEAGRKGELMKWCISTSCCFVAGIFAFGVNSASLYNSWQYSKETIRGKSTDLIVPGQEGGATGLSNEYITQWSYGIDETATLLIPNVKGGATVKPVGGSNRILSVAELPEAQEAPLYPQDRQALTQFAQYFGDQPMTNGPVYVGAVVLALALLALFVVDGAIKWALFAVSVLAILLSWGHNFSPLTDFFIGYFPGYNKFRTVSSILVIVEFTIPLLAAMCLRKILTTPDFLQKFGWTFYTVFGFCAFICLLGWITPTIFGPAFSASEMEQLTQMGVMNNPPYASFIEAIRSARLGLVSGDSLRSLLFLIVGFIIIWLWLRGVFQSKAIFMGCLTLLAVIDLYPLNKRYVNSDNFVAATPAETAFNKTAADEAILRDTTNYRVLDLQGFADARSSYFHKTIGGYHAAKLTRYNDLIEHQMTKNNMNVFNMLNAKYFLYGDQYEVNPDALGNAWFIDGITYVTTPNQEMAALDTLNPGTWGVADVMFRPILGEASPVMAGDTIFETTYAPNKLTYKSRTARENIAVFSEIFFPWGWTAKIDGKDTQIGRVDYVLRAMRIPAGEHEIEMKFDPRALHTTNALAIISLILIGILCAGALGMWGMELRNHQGK